MFILLLTTNLILFSSFVLDEDFKYNIGGFSYCILLSMVIIFNFYFIFKNMFLQIKLIILKTYFWLKNKYHLAVKEYEQAHPEEVAMVELPGVDKTRENI